MLRKKVFSLSTTGKDPLSSFIKGCDLVKEIAKKEKTKEKPKQQSKKYTQKEYTEKVEDKHFNIFLYTY